MNTDLFIKEKEYFIHTYNRIPIDLAYGEGVHLIDRKGNRYLDFFSGLGVNALGYSHPLIVKAVSDQISKFGHLSNYFLTDIQVEFSEKLLKYSKMSKVFLSNSGTEAVEAAIKLIRKKFGPDKKIFSLSNAFHGRTYGALSLTANDNYRTPFLPLLPNIHQIAFNNIQDLTANIGINTAAVFVEFIQGEGGINMVSEEFVNELKNLRKKFDFILVSDCIQCGIGRTGKAFSHDYYDFEPDIILSAKAIGGGLPLGAMLVNNALSDEFAPGDHGTTFGGNPVSCAAGNVVLSEVFEHGLVHEVKMNGDYLIRQLLELKNMYPDHIKEVRGRGFMIGVDFYYECANIVTKLRDRKIFANCTNKTVLRLLPPLIMEKNDIDFFLYNLHESIKEADKK
ncbi:MAG: acetylornithine/succinylornithine family transaminase [Ignavibacteriaceae bacterium]|nr:acetylornithine/succinylornithine family transaminase [Ignavibacteriaceae bacterium]